MQSALQAIYAKARAMQGLLLKKEDYLQLVQKENIAQLIAQLKQLPGYEVYLRDASNRLHRGALEQLLKKVRFQRMQKLHAYAFSNQAFFSSAFLPAAAEVVLASLLRQKDAFVHSIPLYANALMPFDLNALMQCQNEKETMAFYQDTLFSSIVERFAIHHQAPKLEVELMQLVYAKQQACVKKLPSASAKKVLKWYGMQADARHVELIYRCRFHFHMHTEDITPWLQPFYYRLKPHVIRELMTCSESDYFHICKTAGMPIQGNWRHGLKVSLYQEARKQLYMEKDSYLAYLCAAHLFQVEFDNLCAVIEGIRYQQDAEDILSHVIV